MTSTSSPIRTSRAAQDWAPVAEIARDVLTVAPRDLPGVVAGIVATVRVDDPLGRVVVLVPAGVGRRPLRIAVASEMAVNGGAAGGVDVMTPAELASTLSPAAATVPRLDPLMAERLASEVGTHTTGVFARVRGTKGLASGIVSVSAALRSSALTAADVAALDPDSKRLGALADLVGEYDTRCEGWHDAADVVAAADATRLHAAAVVVCAWPAPTEVQRRFVTQLAGAAPVHLCLPDATLRPATGRTDRAVVATDPTAEAELAAAACLGWAAEGIGWHEMAIVTRTERPYVAPLVRALRRAEIPFASQWRAPIVSTQAGRATALLADLVGQDMPRAATMDFLTTTRLPEAVRESMPENAKARTDVWDRRSRSAGILGGVQQWRQRLLLQDQDDPQVIGMRHVVTALAADLDSMPGRARWGAMTAAFCDLAERWVADAARPLAAIRAMGAALDATGEMVYGAEFGAAVREQLEAQRTVPRSTRRLGRSGVQLLDARSAAGMRFSAVAVLGLADGLFPLRERPEPLLRAEVRRALADRHGVLVPGASERSGLDADHFALATAAATTHLQISRPATLASDAHPRNPSTLWLDACAALGLDAEPPRLAAPALDPAAFDAQTAGRDPVSGAAVAALEPQVAAGRASWAAQRADHLTEWTGVVDPDLIADLRKEQQGPMSATTLEQHASCPREHFFHKVLGLRAVDDPAELDTIEPARRGTLVHYVLERFLRELTATEPPERPDDDHRDAHVALLTAYADEAFDDAEARGQTGPPLVAALTRAELHRDLRLWYDAECREARSGEPWAPWGFEVAFGRPLKADERERHSQEEAIAWPGTEPPVAFAGRIDRIDVSADGRSFRVIDYKTGKLTDRDLVGTGTALQLPLYLVAGAELVGLAPEDGTAEYLSVGRRGGGRARVTLTGAEFAADSDVLAGRVRALADASAHGPFPPTPSKDECGWCDFRSVCDISIKTIAAEQTSDPAVVRHHDLVLGPADDEIEGAS